MSALHCPSCGKAHFGKTDMVVVQRLMAADKALTAKELLEGLNVDRGSWQAVCNRIRADLPALGLKLVNVAGNGPWIARYRLQPVEEA